MTQTARALIASLAVCAPSVVFAEPNVDQAASIEAYLTCTDACHEDEANGLVVRLQACLASCPVADPDWDYDLSGSIDHHDYELAVAHAAGDTCLRPDGALQLEAACCTEERTEAECVRDEATGLMEFQRSAVMQRWEGTPARCVDDIDCTGLVARTGFEALQGFDTRCEYVAEAGDRYCQVRWECIDAAAGTCTAFHIEKVSEDAVEVIVHLVFDYAPVAPTIMDLTLTYPKTQLTLLDARPLPSLRRAFKEVRRKETATGVRLVILGATTTMSIEPGPIVELVFARNSTSAAAQAIAFDFFSMNPRESLAPRQGSYQDTLREQSLWGRTNDDDWGRSLSLANMADSEAPRLMLHYSFDNPSAPLVVNTTPSAAELCALDTLCASAEGDTPEDIKRKAVRRSQYEALHAGDVRVSEAIRGVSGPGAFFEGRASHIELPPDLHDDFSLSLWLYNEGDGRASSRAGGQLLFSHHALTENTRYGLQLRPVEAQESFELVWFEGDLAARDIAARQQIAATVDDRVWTHVALTFDAARSRTSIYVNGDRALVADLEGGLPAPPVCPQFDPQGNLAFPLMGEARRVEPDALLVATNHSGLYAVETMNLHGLSRHSLLREADRSFRDPDYSAAVDKIAYVSTATGNHEIWIANPDGTGAKQITAGFGDTSRGIFARRPRFSPDGSGLVFESNIYDVDSSYNTWGQTYQLYYIRYNAEAKRVEIPYGSGYLDQLDFRTLDDNDDAHLFALTTGPRHHTHAQWLNANELVLGTAARLHDRRDIARITLSPGWRDTPVGAIGATSLGLVSEVLEEEATLLAAAAQDDGSKRTLLWRKSWGELLDSSDYEVVWDAHALAAQIWYRGPGSSTVDDLVVRYASPLKPLLDNGTVRAVPSAFIQDPDNAKRLLAEDRDTTTGKLVALRVVNTTAEVVIPPHTLIATLYFATTPGATDPPAAPFARVRKVLSETYVTLDDGVSLTTLPLHFDPAGSVPEQVTGAVLEPSYRDISFSGTRTIARVALTAIVDARPAVYVGEAMRIDDAAVTTTLRPITDSVKVSGMAWMRRDRFFPCEWMGAYRDPGTGLYDGAFRGGMDEVRLHNYVRDPRALLSETERGRERLVKEGRAGRLDRALVTCTEATEHLACPPHQLCADGVCSTLECSDTTPCDRGRCAVLPVPVGLDTETLKRVCTAECAVDSDCFQMDCLNGPCRFCEAKACIECKESVGEFGITTLAGCPDANGFWCGTGSCLTECYSLENDASQYLCDPAVEYCDRGRCKLFDWAWSDLAPATFAGAGLMRVDRPDLMDYPTVTPQNYPVRIEAFGVEDYANPPELLVQGRHSALMGGAWFDIGLVRVHNRTQLEAQHNHYVLGAAYPYENLRMRLVSAPTRNVSRGATGLDARLDTLCEPGNLAEACCADYAANCLAQLDALEQQTKASLPRLGYRVGVPTRQAWADLSRKVPLWQSVDSTIEMPGPAQGVFWDTETAAYDAYLYGGQPAVIITKIQVGKAASAPPTPPGGESPPGSLLLQPCGTGSPVAGCTYEGSAGAGDVLKNTVCPSTSVQGHPTARFAPPIAHSPTGFGVLNCNHATDDGVAELIVRVPEPHHHVGGAFQVDSNGVIETANSCHVLIDDRTNTFASCFEAEGEIDLDPMNFERTPFRTLDFDLFHSFGSPMETIDIATLDDE